MAPTAVLLLLVPIAVGAQTPIVVPPPIIAPPGPPAAAMTPRPVAPPVVVDRPATVITCDANGCWASDGVRLNRVAPQLLAPTGACIPQAGQPQCP